jgi:hypothetical protein
MDGIHVAHLISFLCCVVFLAWFFRHMSCVPKGASISGLSVHDCPFGFSTVYLWIVCSWLPLRFLYRLSLDCLFMIAPFGFSTSISGLSVHDCPFGFSTVYKTKNVSSLPLSTMCRLDFGALPTVWYFLVLSFSFIEVLLSYLLGKRLSNYISVKPLRYDWWT